MDKLHKVNIAMLLAMVTGAQWLSSPAQAQDWFVTPSGGYSFAASDFDLELNNNTLSSSAAIKEGEHWGLAVGMNTPEPGNIYLLYSRQSTELVSQGGASSESLTPLSIEYLHFGGTLLFPNGNFSPYITTSIGFTRLRPEHHLSSESRFSMGIGAGMQYQLVERLSLVVEVRAFATFVDSDQQLFCDETGCLWRVQADIFWQSQANLGLSYRF
ncbi:outer membrane beta-barrel protein [Shewanella sp. SNU WT4]|uniref:outer membrane beta-barrel protein n=1 Tax=Shewanella sp. SNU WT4 TaxID=2590015 RepID=UPI001F109E3E|nr:outer membrane beta-barrel protein [Shewanella sp. SNU WT4]